MSKKTNSNYVTPNCCAAVKEQETIILQYVDYNTDGKPPFWAAMSWDKHKYDLIVVNFCPHCGLPLPKIVLSGITEPICSTTDLDYCDVCHERLMGCTCLPMEFKWKAEEKP